LLGIKTGLSLDKIQATPAVQVEDTAGTNWLLVGSDSREGLSIEEQQQLHTGQDEGAQRTDTIMLVH
jgi:anionic cell wall polymer biosynthesis LytR-Cps2A-Psr (LCP) family protein